MTVRRRLVTNAPVRMGTVLLVIGALVGGCQTVSDDVLALNPDAGKHREAESRRFENVDEAVLLDAAGAALQDLGFSVSRTQADAGLVTASKRGSAISPGQIVGHLLLAVLIGSDVPWDEEQEVRASLLIRQPTDAPAATHVVRLNLQREVWDYNGNSTLLEPVHDETIFQEFFDRLDASLFYEEERL